MPPLALDTPGGQPPITDPPREPERTSRLRPDAARRLSFRKLILPLIALGAIAAGLAWWAWPPVPLDFRAAEKKVYSQFGEDGVTESIFTRIKPTSRFVVDIGSSDGVTGSNSRNLILNHGWSALLIEGDPEHAALAQGHYRDVPRVKAIQAWVYPGNVELLLEDHGVPLDVDLLSIDIDSNDWYVWRVITEYRPKAVIMEYNPGFVPPRKAVVAFNPNTYWDETDYYGASLQSLYDLGQKKGYELVYCESAGANAFFVDRRYFKRFGITDNSPRRLYRPATYGLGRWGRGPGGTGWPNFEDPRCGFIDGQPKRRIECPQTISVNPMVIQKRWVER